MVATIAALKSASQAASYYEADDYYDEGGLAPSQWQGRGAERLGLSGPVESDHFAALLRGEVDGVQLGTVREGQLEHRPGWDLTFSAPKSVSIMAEVAGDRRLFEAHENAVRTALDLAEQHLSATRIRQGCDVSRHATDNLVIASFRHGTSRSLDPQLHSHNVILNMTCDAGGQWRSLEPRALYQLQKQLGAIYRQELAAEVRRLGYEIETARDSQFEIAGIEPEVMKAFSQRSVAIEAQLAERGKSRATASAAEKQTIALDTRQTKEAVAHTELIGDWRRVADEAGWYEQSRGAMVRAAENSAVGADRFAADAELAADRMVMNAASSVGERNSVFAATDLHEAAGRFGMGRVGHRHIAQAITRAQQAGTLEQRSFTDKRGADFAGFTTKENIATETALLDHEKRARGQAAPLLSASGAGKAVQLAEGRSKLKGYGWTDEQRAATIQIFTSANRVTALQGAAGTAKTSTVLATVAEAAKTNGVKVTALAPTASAAQVLGEALDARADTLARHLLSPGRTDTADHLWIVDEASLVSARDAAKLLALAEVRSARVLLVGDRAQLGSVEAGAAFAQLQDAGMETAKLTQILRQTNANARASVEASLEGDARKALEALDAGGGKVIEVANREDRFQKMARDYAAMPAEQRKQTLVIEPSRAGRDELTRRIREELVERGQLGSEALIATRLVRSDMTRAEAKDAANYAVGDVVQFAKDYGDKGVSRHEAYAVVGIDRGKSAIRLADTRGREIDWRLRQWGSSSVSVFTVEEIKLRRGDQIQFTRNDRALSRVNGRQSEVVAIDAHAKTVHVRSARGKVEKLDFSQPHGQHIAHNYVATAFAAQGRTAGQVLVNADSSAIHLLDQKSFYVGLSRAKMATTVYTNDRKVLIAAMSERSGVRQAALAINQASEAEQGLPAPMSL
ncbi:MAG: conjugative relaxase [Novosphingobium sp.]|uniref:MobF family relaxase n=1 Tax=Novosphingobium sp. TaxID=1874826 RepID=UPI0012CF1DE7|nr:MobF family relaxase [Novosphingobium sp.]MPS71348.1 conjugative relaxase [Novosphingobium sp.]